MLIFTSFTFIGLHNSTFYYTNGYFNTSNDARSGKYIFRGLTTDDFLNEIFIGNVTDSNLDFQNNSMNTVEIFIIHLPHGF